VTDSQNLALIQYQPLVNNPQLILMALSFIIENLINLPNEDKMEGHINITLRLRDKDVDIRIPKRIEVRRFIRAFYTSPLLIR